MSTTTQTFPRSGHDTVGGLVFFARMLDKIRLHAAGTLPADYHLGKGFDARTCRFLQLDFTAIEQQALAEKDDAIVLEWCYTQGRRPSEEDIALFNAFISKRGWRDEASEKLKASKEKLGWADREDIQTMFDLLDAEEGRK